MALPLNTDHITIDDPLAVVRVKDVNCRFSTRASVHVDEAMKEIRPLDLILFSGSDWVSTAIRKIEDLHAGEDRYSHCGIVVSREVFPFITEMKPGALYILESTMSSNLLPATDGVPNIRGNYKFGVQIRDLRQTVLAYNRDNAEESSNGSVGLSAVTWVPVLNTPIRRGGLTLTQMHALKRIYSQYGNAPYDLFELGFAITPYILHRPMRFILRWTKRVLRKTICNSALYDRPCLELVHDSFLLSRFTNLLDDDAQFCSELVARMYREIGLIDITVEPETISPVEFITGKHGSIHLEIESAIDLTGQVWDS